MLCSSYLTNRALVDLLEKVVTLIVNHEPPTSRVVLLRKERNPSSQVTHYCRVPVEIGFEPDALELTPFACL